jgi:hypothetical protein
MGEFWTSVLWDLSWAYIQYGFDNDIYSRLEEIMKLFTFSIRQLKNYNHVTQEWLQERNTLFLTLASYNWRSRLLYDCKFFRGRGFKLNASQGKF